MIATDSEIATLQRVCTGARVLEEGSVSYVFLPDLHLPAGCDPGVVNALLRPSPGPDGYTSRLFLSVAFPHRGQNWTTHHILDRTWHAFSYNNVQADLPFIEILSNHLAVLK